MKPKNPSEIEAMLKSLEPRSTTPEDTKEIIAPILSEIKASSEQNIIPFSQPRRPYIIATLAIAATIAILVTLNITLPGGKATLSETVQLPKPNTATAEPTITPESAPEVIYINGVAYRRIPQQGSSELTSVQKESASQLVPLNYY